MTTDYDGAFFAHMTSAASHSAQVVAPLVLDLLPPVKSVVDVGCGTGAWGRAFQDLGAHKVLGVDGAYVDPAQMLVDFQPADLAAGMPDVGRFDLVVCLEVAEHLPETRAASFVRDLTALAPLVLFSAAAPGQGGTNHVNEQWPDYWISLFQHCGYLCVDALRPALRYDERVAWFYRQNLMLASADPLPVGVRGFPVLQSAAGWPIEYVSRDIVERPRGGRQIASDIKELVRRQILRR